MGLDLDIAKALRTLDIREYHLIDSGYIERIYQLRLKKLNSNEYGETKELRDAYNLIMSHISYVKRLTHTEPDPYSGDRPDPFDGLSWKEDYDYWSENDDDYYETPKKTENVTRFGMNSITILFFYPFIFLLGLLDFIMIIVLFYIPVALAFFFIFEGIIGSTTNYYYVVGITAIIYLLFNKMLDWEYIGSRFSNITQNIKDSLMYRGNILPLALSVILNPLFTFLVVNLYYDMISSITEPGIQISFMFLKVVGAYIILFATMVKTNLI